ncbi:DUF3768 domain-containing protein [Rhizobium phage RHEph10]|uniref:DUF3768 domain-containing protein n=1 Tax=Rhizobium phage RHEph10 TaxID=1220717 RepID=UPI0002AB30A0|nr:DUF3768 domain-containing protein [Rhizobium phage RHEph10]AGC36153.1 hypothetical protein RHEph10_gp110 [Rhizobium phage RHEph10]
MNWTSSNEHERFKHKDWQYLVQTEQLKLSYHDWVVAQVDEWTSDVRALNDKLRRGQTSGTIAIAGALANAEQEEILAAARQVMDYAAFDPKDDPHNEHDFGSFEIEGQRYMWKIDYYDLAMENLSENPADPKVTNRVLTIFYAEDY